MLRHRTGTAIAVVLAALVLAPAASAANTLYAAPAAQGTDDCSSPQDACPIANAVSNAGSGDTIDVLGNLGDYNLAAGAVAPGPKTLHLVGTNGTPKLIGNSSTYLMRLTAPGSSAVGLYLEQDGGGGDGMSISPSSGTITVDRVYMKEGGSGHPCYLGGGVTLTNSVCWQANSSASNLGIETDGANTLRNDVAWVNGGGVGIRCFGRSGVAGDDTLINTIVRAVGAGDADLAASAEDGTATATFNVTYSNFGTTSAEGTAVMDHFNTDATDQNAAPALVSPTAGNFHELSGSPTINAGITDPANGAQDLDGNARTVNGKTDIGAYELGAPPITPPTPPSNHFVISPRESCAFAGCKVILVKVTFDSAGNVVAEQDTGLAAPDTKATASKKKKKHKVLIKTLSQAVTAGTNTLRLRLTKAAVKQLKKNHKLKIRVRFVFTPTGGTPSTQVQTLTIKLKKKKKK